MKTGRVTQGSAPGSASSNPRRARSLSRAIKKQTMKVSSDPSQVSDRSAGGPPESADRDNAGYKHRSSFHGYPSAPPKEQPHQVSSPERGYAKVEAPSPPEVQKPRPMSGGGGQTPRGLRAQSDFSPASNNTSFRDGGDAARQPGGGATTPQRATKAKTMDPISPSTPRSGRAEAPTAPTSAATTPTAVRSASSGAMTRSRSNTTGTGFRLDLDQSSIGASAPPSPAGAAASGDSRKPRKTTGSRFDVQPGWSAVDFLDQRTVKAAQPAESVGATTPRGAARALTTPRSAGATTPRGGATTPRSGGAATPTEAAMQRNGAGRGGGFAGDQAVNLFCNGSIGSESERPDSPRFRAWRTAKDPHSQWAHYSYITPVLSTMQAEADSDAGDDKHEHDHALASSLRHRRPSEGPANVTPRSGMIAFTDRAARLREGAGCKAAVFNDGPHAEEADREGWSARGGVAGHPTDCCCPVCHPRAVHAAGQASHMVHTNRTPRCFKETARVDPNDCEKTSQQSGLHSSQMDQALGRAIGFTDDHEATFVRSLGRKAKAQTGEKLTHRGIDDSVTSAGQFNQEVYTELSAIRGKRRPSLLIQEESVDRSAMAMILTPRDSDPAPALQCDGQKRAAGEFKSGFSKESARHVLEANQGMFRFTSERSARSKSVPPQFDGCAGQSRGPPVEIRRFGGPAPYGIEGDLAETGSILDSTKQSYRRTPSNNNSMGMAMVTNHDMTSFANSMHSTWRKQNDSVFADMCMHTDRSHQEHRSVVENIKGACGRQTSSDMKSAFQWME